MSVIYDGNIEITKSNAYFYLDSLSNDMIIYTSMNNQHVLIGNMSNNTSSINIWNSNITFNRLGNFSCNLTIGSNPTYGISNYVSLQGMHDFALIENTSNWPTTHGGRALYMRYSTNGTQSASYIQSIYRDGASSNLQDIHMQASNIFFGTGSTVANVNVTFKPDGKVGIGNSNPQEMFHVVGNTRIVQGNLAMDSNFPIVLGSNAATGNAARIGFNLFSQSNFLDIVGGATSTQSGRQIYFWIDSNQTGGVPGRATFNGGTVWLTTGSFGVGRSNPVSRMHITSNALCYTTYTNDTNSNTGIICGIEDNAGGGVFWNTSNHYLKFGTNNTERMKIAANGYVSIGASNPVNMLHVHNPSTTVDNILQLTNGITGSNVTNGLQLNMDISRNVSLWSIENGYMRFATNNAERMRIDSSGNVGINTGGTISAMLHVNGGTIFVNNNLSAVPATGIVGGTGDRLVLWPGGATHPYSFGIDASTLWSSVPTGAQFRWYVGGVQEMQLTTSGALSLATVSPPSGHILYAMSNAATGLTSKIENQNATSAAFTAISVTNNTTNSCSLFLNSSARTSDGAANVATLRNDAGDLRLAATGTNPYMFLQSSTGRVGVNTITPTSTMQVNGDLDVSTNFKTGNVQRMDNLGNMTNILSINIIPPGTILMFGGAAAPAGWLLCNGSAVSRTTYSLLFAAIGTTYGAGDGSTTFTLPDLRGRVAVGSGTGASLSARTVGNTGGAETHTLSTTEIPSHTHSATTNSAGAHSHAGSSIAANGSHSHTGSTGAAGSHSHGGITGSMNQNWNHAHQTANGAPDDLNYSGTYAAQYPLADGPGAYFNGTITGYTDTNHTHNIGADGSHTHSFTTGAAGSHTHTLTVASDGSHTHTFTTNGTGGGGAHNNMQPFLVVAYMIKT